MSALRFLVSYGLMKTDRGEFSMVFSNKQKICCLLLWIVILSSCSSTPNNNDSSSFSSETDYITEFSDDFTVEYDEDGLIVLTKYCGSGGDVVIPEGINVIGQHVFDALLYTERKVISSIYIPDTVTIIEDYAFLCCCYPDEDEGLRKVRMSSNIEHIGISAFNSCTYLETVEFDTIPQHTVSIDDNAFAYCNSLKDIQLPASILLGSDVFIGTELEEDYSAQYGSLIHPPTSPESIEFIYDERELVPEVVHTENDE